jgi:glutamate synthase (NADPH/NADH) small chain
METDLVLLAMGFTQPEHNGLLDALGLAYDARGNVAVDDTSMTSVPKVFAAGDANTEPGWWSGPSPRSPHGPPGDLYLMGHSNLPDCKLAPALTG